MEAFEDLGFFEITQNTAPKTDYDKAMAEYLAIGNAVRDGKMTLAEAKIARGKVTEKYNALREQKNSE